MPISSLIIRTRKKEASTVAEKLKDFEGLNVEEVLEDSIVVITETKEQKSDKDLWKDIEGTEGVVQCDLIYHNFEDDPIARA